MVKNCNLCLYPILYGGGGSLKRDRIPEIAIERISQRLNNRGENKTQLFNIRDALADPNFKDISHINELGRNDATQVLVDIIKNSNIQTSTLLNNQH